MRPRLAACGCALTTCGCALTAQGRVWPRFGRVRPSFIVIVNYECRLSPRDQADRARGASRGLARPRRGQGTVTRGLTQPEAASHGHTQPGAASRAARARLHAARRSLTRPRRGQSFKLTLAIGISLTRKRIGIHVWRENHVLQGSVVRSGVRYFEAAITYSQDLTQGARLDFEPKMAMWSSEISDIR